MQLSACSAWHIARFRPRAPLYHGFTSGCLPAAPHIWSRFCCSAPASGPARQSSTDAVCCAPMVVTCIGCVPPLRVSAACPRCIYLAAQRAGGVRGLRATWQDPCYVAQRSRDAGGVVRRFYARSSPIFIRANTARATVCAAGARTPATADPRTLCHSLPRRQKGVITGITG